MSTAARGTLGDGVRPASANGLAWPSSTRATSLGMAGRGRVQIHRCVRAAGQPRHRVPLPLLLLPHGGDLLRPARGHDDLLLHTGTTFSVLMCCTATYFSTQLRPPPYGSTRVNLLLPPLLSNSTALFVPWRRWLPPVPQGKPDAI
ncbi:hypothetical protein EJB05_52998, partial [Eragrostis curvula]